MKPDVAHEKIAQMAYTLWIERGQPIGTPEVDWAQAEQILRNAGTESSASESSMSRSSTLPESRLEPTPGDGSFVAAGRQSANRANTKKSNGATPREAMP